ncbi:MAG TPA: LysE family translocator [Candidatus Binatia bacterium]|nr:LysE family translocator [Candidatus Binatia bacterium]
MTDSQIVAFSAAAAVLTVAPGPDTMLVVRNVLRGGRADGVVTTLGICAGLFLHATLSAVGVSAVLVRSATAFRILRLAGACYLAWLGIRSLAGALLGDGADDVADGVAARAVPARRCFTEGLLSNVLNPKTAVFYLALLPQFIAPTDRVFEKSLLLATIHYAESVVWLVFVSIAVDRTRTLVRRPIVRRWLAGACGGVLLGFGVRLAVERE